MIKRYIFAIILLTAFVTSCRFEEENIFSDSSAIRLQNAKKECFNLLCGASNGWVMEYFPNPSVEGYTILVKFNSSTLANMAAKNKYLGNSYTKDSCMFEMISDNGPVLSFNSYGSNKGVLHLFANPEDPFGSSDLDGVGLEGDYEFIVLSTSENEIKLKGKKHGAYVLMHRLPESQNWVDYFNKNDLMNNLLFSKASTKMNLVKGTDTLYVYNGSSHIFRILEKNGDPKIAGDDYPFIITPQGLRLHSLFDFNGVNTQTFSINADNSALVCVENPDIKIVGDELNKQLNSSLLTWTLDTLSMSPTVKTVYNTIRESCKTKYNKPSTGTYVSNVLLALKYNVSTKAFGLQLMFRVKTQSLSGEVYMTSACKPNNGFDLTYIANSGNSNGKVFYTGITGYPDMVTLLSRSFKITSATAINPQDLIFTAVDNNDVKFTVKN